MSIFARLFRNRQAKDCETALRFLKSDFGEVLFYNIIEAKVRDLIRQHPEAVQRKMLIEGQSAQVTVLHAISNIACRELTSGMNHIYRGVLSMEGQSFRQVFQIATNRLISLGAIDEGSAETSRQDLAQAIKEVG